MSLITRMKGKVIGASIAASALFASSGAMAALSIDEQAVLDSISAKVTDYTAPALTVLGAVLGLWITIKWMKRIVTKVG